MKEIKYYKDEYIGLKKYKDDELFRKEIPNIDMLISMLEEDENLYGKYIRDNDLYHYKFIDYFENRKDDIKWFYDNKDKYFKDIICYEDINNITQFYNFENDVEENIEKNIANHCCHNCISLFKRCQSGNYMDAYLQLYVYDDIYLYTSDMSSPRYEDYVNKKELVKDAMLLLIEVINKTYEDYKSSRTKNRDIFKENKDFIILLNQYSKDELFIKEIPNVYEVIEKLEISLLNNDEDDAYRAYWLISDIRDSIRLYEQYREDMEFFYSNRNLNKFISKDTINNKDDYKRALLNYIDKYEESKNFKSIWNYITKNSICIEINNIEIDIQYEHKSIREFIEWIISEINSCY